jgi:hypothetical protein
MEKRYKTPGRIPGTHDCQRWMVLLGNWSLVKPELVKATLGLKA